MTAISVFAFGRDGRMDKYKIGWAERRWLPEDDYLKRLRDAARGHDVILEAVKNFWILDSANVYIAQEEPVPLGMIGKMAGAYVKQQCEISGAFLGSCMRWGYTNIHQINNAEWKAVLKREGVQLRKMPEGKFDVKEWAIQAFDVPDFPDLISKNGRKIPRPEGSRAKAVQPSDIYDAAACAAWMAEQLEGVE